MNYGDACAKMPMGVAPRQTLRATLAETQEVLFRVKDQAGMIRNIIEPEPQCQSVGANPSDNSLLHLANELLIAARFINGQLEGVIDML
jgi:hypothetical protein